MLGIRIVLQFYADPDWHQNNADPHADPAPSFTHDENSELLFIILVTALPIF